MRTTLIPNNSGAIWSIIKWGMCSVAGRSLKARRLLHTPKTITRVYFFALTVAHSGNKASVEISKSRHAGHGLQGSDVRLDLLAVFIVQADELHTQTDALLDVAHA